MNQMLGLLIETIIVFVVILLFNYFGFVFKNRKLKKNDMPLELIYLSGIYEIDPQKVNFKSFQIIYCFVNAFIITTTYILVIYLLDHMLLRIIFGIGLLILLIIICYGLLGRYYLYREEKLNKEEKLMMTKKVKETKKSKK